MNFKNTSTHLSEDTLEQYSLKRIPDGALTEIEEHLLICHVCQDRLEETDSYILAVKQATAEYPARKPHLVTRFLQAFRGLSRPVVGLSFAAALAIFFVVRVPKAEVQTVDLLATRSVGEAHVSSRKSPRLQLAAQGLPTAVPYQVEVVNATGSAVWRGMSSMQNQQLVVSLPSPLAAGKYWIRVYGDTSNRSLLREYGLVAD